MDPNLLGLALSNVEDAANAALRGRDEADKSARMQRESRSQMMDLALKDSLMEETQQKMFLDIVRSVPTRNEPRIQQALALAVDPFSMIESVQAPGKGSTLDEAKALIAKSTSGQAPVIDLNVPSVGVGASMMNAGYASGQLPSSQKKPATREEAQAQSIERLRSSGGRSPQSVDSIVQPLEGDSSPYQNTAGVRNLEPQTIVGDPNAEQALNFIAGEFQGSPYSALRNPQMRQMMIDSMVRQGFIPGLGIQTDLTNKALSDLEQTQFLATKSAAQMNQKAQQSSVEAELKRNEMELHTYERASALAAEQRNLDQKQRFDAKIEELRAMVDILKSKDAANRPRSSSSKEDPNKKDYRAQLNEAQDQFRKAVDTQIAAFGGMVSPEQRARIIKDTISKDPSIAQLISGLREKANRWPDVASNYSQLFQMAGQPLGGSSAPAVSGKKSMAEQAAEILKQRGGK